MTSPLQVLLQFGPGAIATVVMLAASPLLLPKLRLVRERDDARGYARLLEDRIRTLGAGSEGLAAIAERVAELGEAVKEMRKTQVVATRYIADLVRHIRRRGSVETMPPLPPEISDDVLAALRAHDDRGSEAAATA
jgi:hypothetical protein